MKPRSHYVLFCPTCEAETEDDGLRLRCPQPHEDTLLRTRYRRREFTPMAEISGIFRYRRWLPVARTLSGAGRPVAYRSKRLGPSLGLTDLWIAFSGYWPERGAHLETGTFKELEALTVLARLPEVRTPLVLASAGNTAAAFAAVCSRERVPAIVLIPAAGLDRLRLRQELDPCVRLVVIDGAEYADCIALADRVAGRAGVHAEGGVRNVGRRDGLGTVLLAAYEAMRRLPDLYVQAIGSGAGAIAVHEAAVRLRAARPGGPLPRMLLGQNAGFAPVQAAWQGRRTPGREPGALADPARAFAGELTNRRPPFAVRGGLADVLTESDGDIMVAEASEARAAMAAFCRLEGVDIEPAAGVAVACLARAVRSGQVRTDATVLLNVTGGGRQRHARDFALVPPEPVLRLPVGAMDDPDVPDRIAGLCPLP